MPELHSRRVSQNLWGMNVSISQVLKQWLRVWDLERWTDTGIPIIKLSKLNVFLYYEAMSGSYFIGL